jgi:four helix bundle protein
MENNFKKLLSDKAFRFGVDTYRICNSIMKTKNEWILTRQLMRSSTSVGALIAESEHAQSTLDFINKRAVARKECNESFYWIAMMQELELIAIPEAEKLGRQAQELMRLLTSAIKTSKRNLEQSQKKKKEE